MRLTFQIEKWRETLPELLPMFGKLWDDVAVDKERFIAVCDRIKYQTLDDAGLIHLVTARNEAKELVGYFVMLIQSNAHYCGQGLMAFTDMYYLKPEYRIGMNGVRMFEFMETSLRKIGCVKAYTSHKCHRDRSLMFEALGWKATDIVYSKVLD